MNATSARCGRSRTSGWCLFERSGEGGERDLLRPAAIVQPTSSRRTSVAFVATSRTTTACSCWNSSPAASKSSTRSSGPPPPRSTVRISTLVSPKMLRSAERSTMSMSAPAICGECSGWSGARDRDVAGSSSSRGVSRAGRPDRAHDRAAQRSRPGRATRAAARCDRERDGPGPYFTVEADDHHANLNVCLIGDTSKGRKGSSWGHIHRLVKSCDAAWVDRIESGLVSGEGLIYAVRDATDDDDGVSDKRLLVIEPEFANVLRVFERQSNRLSAVVRDAWDGRLSAT